MSVSQVGGAGDLSQEEQSAVTERRRKAAHKDVTSRGEQVGVGLSALATLLKVADEERLYRNDEGEAFLISLGCLVDVLGSEVLNITENVRTVLR